MKTLILRIENYATLENGGPVTLTLTGQSAQIGRKAGMDWILPDPSRHISGHHFDVMPQGDGYVLVDVSSNGTFLQGERYRMGGPHQIQDGDRFTVGHYIVRAELHDSAAAAPFVPEMPSPAPAAPVPIPPQDQGYAPPSPPPSYAPDPTPDPFDDVWGDGDAPAGDVPAPAPSGLQQPSFLNREPSAPPGVMTPDLSALQNSSAPSDLSIPPIPQAAPPQMHTPPAPDPAQMPAAPPAPQPTQAPQLGEASAADTDAFVRAFLEGAGVTEMSQLSIPPQQLARMMGQIARTGTRELTGMLADRKAIKQFVSDTEVTHLAGVGNNPMKFADGNPEQAFESMFLTPREGYMTGEAAFENALVDIRKHQKAMMAAMQPALAEMIEGLGPDEIEDDIGGRVLGGGTRKLWDEYVKRWEARAAQGDNGMLDAFVKAFSKHYSDAVRKL